ncbi:Autophagy-related protein 16-2 [Anabarilius grahami]|uniref:Autophagy-related protein 16-2 n=1 Tax=Anabarilius grahami TaxID=495550 RepID=A0A3N0YDD5_ANAGA|nr:Autophagy-related protein 16-2 [Anabarilius grahami]
MSSDADSTFRIGRKKADEDQLEPTVRNTPRKLSRPSKKNCQTADRRLGVFLPKLASLHRHLYHKNLQGRKQDTEASTWWRQAKAFVGGSREGADHSLLEKSKQRALITKGILGSGSRPSVVPSSEDSLTSLKTTTGELAYQVVELQQRLQIKEVTLDEQHTKLYEVQKHLSVLASEHRVLQERVAEVQTGNQLLKQNYDSLLEQHQNMERTYRQEKLHSSEILENMIQLKQQAAARMNHRNEKRVRARAASLHKELQMAASKNVDINEDSGNVSPSKPSSPKCETAERVERSHGPLFRSASATSPRIISSIRGLFERKIRGKSVCRSEEDLFIPLGVCLVARVPTKAIFTLDAHELGINAVRFSTSSNLLATGGTDRVIKLWDIEAGTLQNRGTLDGSNEGITSIEFDPTGTRILAASYDKSALFWRLEDSVPKVTLTGHSRKVTAAKFKYSQRQVVTGSADRTVKIWDLQRAACIQTIEVLSFCSDVVCSEYLIISSHYDRKIRFWDSRQNPVACSVSAQGIGGSFSLPSPVGSSTLSGIGSPRRGFFCPGRELVLQQSNSEEKNGPIKSCPMSTLVLSSYNYPLLPVCLPSLPLPPPLQIPASSFAQSPLSPVSPSVPPPPALCGVDTPWASRFITLSGCSYPLAPHSDTDPVTPPRPGLQTPPTWFLPPLASPGTIGLTAPPRSGVATDLQAICCAPSLHPYGSVWLRLPSGSVSDLSLSGSTSDLRYPGSTSGDRRHSSVTATEAFGVVPDHQLSVCALGSTGSVSICHPHGLLKEIYTMAPPSLDSAVGHPGWTLEFNQTPPLPGFPLASPTLHSLMDCFQCPALFFLFVFSTPSSRAPSLLTTCTQEVPLQGRGTSLDLCPNHRQLLSCSRDDILQLVDLRKSNDRVAFRAEGFKCGSDSTKAIFSPDGSFLAAGSADGAVYIWNVNTGNLEKRLPEMHSAPISAVAWSLSGEYVVSVDKSRRAVLWSDI